MIVCDQDSCSRHRWRCYRMDIHHKTPLHGEQSTTGKRVNRQTGVPNPIPVVHAGNCCGRIKIADTHTKQVQHSPLYVTLNPIFANGDSIYQPYENIHNGLLQTFSRNRLTTSIPSTARRLINLTVHDLAPFFTLKTRRYAIPSYGRLAPRTNSCRF